MKRFTDIKGNIHWVNPNAVMQVLPVSGGTCWIILLGDPSSDYSFQVNMNDVDVVRRLASRD
jgi:hypothetical protein